MQRKEGSRAMLTRDEEAPPTLSASRRSVLALAHTMDPVDDALVARSSAVTDWNRTLIMVLPFPL